jgi:hypothetical protein
MFTKISSYYTRKDGKFNGDAMAFEIANDTLNFKVWFSYETPVAFKVNGIMVIANLKYSNTTSKHLKAIDPYFKESGIPFEMFNRRLQMILANINLKSSE